MKNDNNNLKDEKSNELRRDLGFFAIVAIIVGQMIGSGIYMTPQGLAELSNPFVSVVAKFCFVSVEILPFVCK